MTSCNINPDTSSDESVELVEVINTNGVNNQGILTVTGDVKNISEQNIKKIVITVTFYDNAMNELTKGKDVSEDILLPDDTYHFKVNCIKKDAEKYDIYVETYT